MANRASESTNIWSRWFIPPIARWQAARDELETSARSMDTEYRVIHPDGSLRYVHHIAQTTAAARRPRVLRQVGTLHDITDRRRAEDEARDRCRTESRTSGVSPPWVNGCWYRARSESTASRRLRLMRRPVNA